VALAEIRFFFFFFSSDKKFHPSAQHRAPLTAPLLFTSHQHNTMAQKVNLTDPDFEGYLTKQSAWLKEWRKRYFVLKENQLHFCKQKGVDPHGTVDLQQCLTVKSAEEKTGKR
jgi:hypothetical protein